MLPSLQSGGGGCNLLWGVFVAGTLACNLLADRDVILSFSPREDTSDASPRVTAMFAKRRAANEVSSGSLRYDRIDETDHYELRRT